MSQNIATVEVRQLNSNATSLLHRVYTVVESDPDAGQFASGVLLNTNQTSISLPFTSARQVLIKNTSTVNNITVVWTPNGGAEATVNKLGPGAMILLWDDTAPAAGIGITSLKLTASSSPTTYEVFVGG